jgi:PAS domain S-box-containing protein
MVDERQGRGDVQLEELFDRLPVACVVVDDQLRVIEWNPAAEVTFGHRKDEVLGANGFALVAAPAGRAAVDEMLAQLASGAPAAHATAECKAKDGRLVWCEWRATAVRRAGGGLAAILATAHDVSAHKQIEAQLQRHASFLAESQRLAHVGSWSLDVLRGEVCWSEEHYRLLGLEPQAGPMPADRGIHLVHPDDRAEVQRRFSQALEDHQPFESHWRGLHADGSVRYEHSRVQIALDDQGAPIRMFGTTQDVTEQRKAELALLESEAKFRTLAEASPAIIWFLAPDARALYVNQRCAEFFGMDQAVLGSSWQELIHPSDAPAYVEALLTAVRERAPFEARGRARRRDGVWRWMESHALPHSGEDGRYLGHVGHSLDITDQLETTAFLRQSEVDLAAELAGMARLQEVSTRLVQTGDSTSLLQEIVDAAIAITAADMGIIQLFDPATSTLEIVASRGLGREFLECFATGGEGACTLAVRTGERIVVEDVSTSPLFEGRRELEVLTACGVRAVQSTPLISRTGQLVGVLSTHYRVACRPASRDLHVLDLLARQAADWIERRIAQDERERLLERERVARAESERAARLKDEFLATLSHELRTPLSAILGWADVLREKSSDPQRVVRGVEVIGRNARAQAQLIDDLLDLSRVITGKMRLNTSRLALSSIIEAAIEAVRPAADARDIHLESSLHPMSELIHGDAARLQQVLWNLLSNAVKFTGEGGRVVVSLRKVGSHAEIRVSDTGKGMRADFLPHVFERFRQADSSAAREHGGLGIGLALVKELTELHGGDVRAHSPGEGMGSTFTIRLPLASIQDGARSHTPSRAFAPLPPVAPALDGVKVLVLDDELDALEVIQHILEARRVQVSTFHSVDGALDALASQRFDVLLSDIGMPRRDGYEFIAEVRRRGIKTPAAALTAFARSEDRTRALLAGFQAHLAKPLESSELLATVAALSGRIG